MKNFKSLAIFIVIQIISPVLFFPYIFAQKDQSNDMPLEMIGGNGMMFTQNKGQLVDMKKNLRPDLLFKGKGNGTDVYIRRTGVSFVLCNIGEVMNDLNEALDDERKLDKKPFIKINAAQEKIKSGQTEKVKLQRVDMDFVDANKNPVIVPDLQVDGYDNYYLAHCRDGISNVYSYNELKVKDIYNNTDVIYNGDRGRGFKYTIIVNPGGDASHIKIRYSGAQSIKLHNDGLQIETTLGPISDFIPKVYQKIRGKIINIEAKYTIENISEGEAIIGFQLSDFNKDFPLFIDPWITYYSGSSTDMGLAIAADRAGNIAFTGQTNSPDFPISPGAFQTTLVNMQGVAFVVKMDADDHRVFGTYLGGSTGLGMGDFGSAISCDETGNVYVAGYTYSTDFPVGASTGNYVHQNTIGIDMADAFLSKFDPTGARLWATFYGGDSADYASGVAVDRNSNTVILYGTTCSTNNIITSGALQTVKKGLTDAFIVKFASNGLRNWGTYLGGSGTEYSSGVCCDHSGNIFVCGTTISYDTSGFINDFPVLAGHQMNFGGGNYDCFISKINASGTNLIWSSFYGGSYMEYGGGITIDGADNVIMGGYTMSTNAIATPGAYQTTIDTCTYIGVGLLVKFNNDGVRQWGTYLHGADQGVTGIACDANNDIITGGDTYCTSFPVTSCAYQKVFIGSEDQFIATFKPDGNLMCSGLLGLGDPSSPNNETMQMQCIAVNGCYVFLCAFTNCNYPVTPGAYQTTCGGGDWDAAIAKLYLSTCGGLTSTIDFTGPDSVCLRHPVNFNALFTGCDNTNLSYLWTFPGAAPLTSTSASPSGITYHAAGIYDIKLVINQSCGKDSLIKKDYVHVYECKPTTLEAFNVFTPNGDGYNDVYKVKYEGDFNYFSMIIYNRWGRKMFETNNIDDGWSCNKCSDGTYYYVITANGKDGKTYDLHGTVTLLR